MLKTGCREAGILACGWSIIGLIVATTSLVSCYRVKALPPLAKLPELSPFDGEKPGDARQISGIWFRWIPAGIFTMGSPPGEPGRRPGENQVQVMISKGYWAGQFEVTQGEWYRVMGAFPATFNVGEGDDFPMYRVTFYEAEDFCRKLTELAHDSGALPDDWEFRLPTEAQWEYAARAGTSSATSFGDSLSSKQANFSGSHPYNEGEIGPSLNRTTPVGSYPPNPWGLFDVHGNVFEWTRDWAYSQLPGGVDPDLHDVRGERNRDGTFPKIRRGGCYADEGWALRSAFRVRFEPERRHEHIGFRIVAVKP